MSMNEMEIPQMVKPTVVKEFLKQHSGGVARTSGDFLVQANQDFAALLVKAYRRAKGNGRKTIQKGDL